MSSDTYQVKISDIFEGPMDLLVYLIKKNEVDIYDIPIALITDQYLAYIEWMKSMNIDVAGDFILLAATLAQVKSKMLLPVHDDEDEEEDPRSQITGPLQEYLEMKSAAEQLAEKDLLGENIFVRPSADKSVFDAGEPEMIQVGLFELIDAFRRILENVSPDHHIDLSADTISVKDRIAQLVDILEEKGSITFDELFASPLEKSDVIVTFLAVLEMVRLRLLKVAQHAQTGIMRIFYQ